MNRRRCVTSNEAVPAKRQHINPCSDCPWARTAINGWLGGLTAEDWLREAPLYEFAGLDPTVGDTRMGTPHTDPDHRLCSHPDCVATQKRAADVAEAQHIALEALLVAIDEVSKRRSVPTYRAHVPTYLGIAIDRVIEAREAYRLAMGAGEV